MCPDLLEGQAEAVVEHIVQIIVIEDLAYCGNGIFEYLDFAFGCEGRGKFFLPRRCVFLRTQIVVRTDAAIGQLRGGHLRPAAKGVQQHGVQPVALPDGQAEVPLQFLKGDTAAPTGGAVIELCLPAPSALVFRALPEDEVRRPLHLGIEDIPHPRDIGRVTGIVEAR